MKLFGFEINYSKKNPPKYEELGKTGTTILAGQIITEEYAPELVGKEALKIYDRMRRSDGVVKATLMACELPIRTANWFIQPVTNSLKDKEIADFVSDCLFNKMTITWNDFLRQALMMISFGFMVFEKVFQEVKFQGMPMIGWRKFAPRLPKTIFAWETVDKKDGITQYLMTGEKVSIPIEKLLIFTFQKEGDNWEGISGLRTAYRSWYLKEQIEKINAMGFERQGLGVPYAKLPMGHTELDRRKAIEFLTNLRANETGYVIIPQGWEVGFLDMKGGTIKDPQESIRRYNREIFIGVLAQFLDLGAGPPGSYALSADQTSTFHNNLTAIAKQIKDIINRYAIQQLVDLNYDNVQNYPTLEFTKVGRIDVDELSNAISRLTISAVPGEKPIITPDESIEDYLREVLGLPQRKKVVLTVPEKKPIEEKKEEVRKIASEFKARRLLTFAEGKVRFSELNDKMDTLEEGLRKDLRFTLKKITDDLILQIDKILGEPSSTVRVNLVQKLKINFKERYQKQILETLENTFEYAKQGASYEMKKTPPPTKKDQKAMLRNRAITLTDTMISDILKVVKQTLLESLQKEMSEKGRKFQFIDRGFILRTIKNTLEEKSSDIWNTVPATIVGGTINQGRRFTFDTYRDDIYALQRSEILDVVTCNYCLSVDGRVFSPDDPFTKNDIFHFFCRGIWVEIMKEEEELPDITDIPDTLRERFTGITDPVHLKKPIYIRKGTPADEFVRVLNPKIAEHSLRDIGSMLVMEGQNELGEKIKKIKLPVDIRDAERLEAIIKKNLTKEEQALASHCIKYRIDQIKSMERVPEEFPGLLTRPKKEFQEIEEFTEEELKLEKKVSEADVDEIFNTLDEIINETL